MPYNAPSAAEGVTMGVLHRAAALLFLLIGLLAQASCAAPSSPSGGAPFRANPYEVLGVASDCTQKEIQRQYRKLCLEHHPDKNRSGDGNAGSGNGEDDFHFKEIQHAYSQIGSEEDRRKYDLMRQFSRHSAANSRDVFAKYATNNGNGFQQRDMNMFGGPSTIYFTFGDGLSFKVSGGRMNDVFRASRGFARDSPFGGANARSKQGKPHYVQKVSIPLEVLYAGGENVELTLKTSVLERYKAAYRGKVLMPIVMQGALTVILTWLRSQRVNWPLSIFLFLSMVHLNLPPPPAKTSYPTDFGRGWKGGTKINYASLDGDVKFVVQEGTHDNFSRVGNDLHTQVEITRRQLRKGCTLTIDPLCETEEPITVRLNPQVKSGQVITVKNRGWPKKGSKNHEPECGDLQIKIHCLA